MRDVSLHEEYKDSGEATPTTVTHINKVTCHFTGWEPGEFYIVQYDYIINEISIR